MNKNRLLGIDGLKGIAILAVIFTHIPLNIWFTIIPSPIQSVTAWALSSGGVGVTIFFLVTGFLMGLLYPAPTSKLKYYARRYARLFPAFLVMVTSFTVFQLIKIPGYQKILVVLSCITAMSLILKGYPRVKTFILKTKGLILPALFIQLVVALWYMFYLLKVPPAIFYINWSPTIRTIITFIINATMTLPFGNYIAQLDGVYWALCAEVFFYLLYPVFFAPLIQYASKKISRLGKILLLLSLFPFCYGLFFISQRIFGFEMLQLQLIIYFIVGTYIGINYSTITHRLSKFSRIFAHPVWLIGLLGIVFSSVVLSGYINTYTHRWVDIFMSVFAGVLLISIIAIPEKTKTLLKIPLLVFLGKYSYAIFLTHSFAIHIAQEYIPLSSAINAIAIIVFSMMGAVILGLILYRFVEHPYFIARKKSSLEIKQKPVYAFNYRRGPVVILSTAVLLLTYIAYKPPLAFFTSIYRSGGSPPWTMTDQKIKIITDKPIRQPLIGTENNLGMTTTYIRRKGIPNSTGTFVPIKLYARLFDEKNTMISQSTYNAYEIIEDRYFPFGFPLQESSIGKKYIVEYQLSENSPVDHMQIITNEADILSVYFVEKKALFKNPQKLFVWATQKLAEPLTNPMYWFTLIQVIPFISILFYYQHRHVFTKNHKPLS